MLGIFEQTPATETLYPYQDPEVLRLEIVLREVSELAQPAAQAWSNYIVAHCDEPVSFPFSRQKQRLYDAVQDTSEALAVAEAAYTFALDAATAKATALWNDRIRQQFLDDLPVIETFIALLEKHEQLLIEAQTAGVTRSLNVPMVFVTSQEVRTRLAYARGQLGL